MLLGNKYFFIVIVIVIAIVKAIEIGVEAYSQRQFLFLQLHIWLCYYHDDMPH